MGPSVHRRSGLRAPPTLIHETSRIGLFCLIDSDYPQINYVFTVLSASSSQMASSAKKLWHNRRSPGAHAQAAGASKERLPVARNLSA
ncbi:protein of unknown function [Paraburkholderia kururiensis]